MDNNEPKSRTVWQGLPKATRSRAIAGFIVHALLVVAALRSLSKHDVADLRGPKSLWKGVIPASIVNVKSDTAWMIPLGPVLYFVLGRRRRKAG